MNPVHVVANMEAFSFFGRRGGAYFLDTDQGPDPVMGWGMAS